MELVAEDDEVLRALGPSATHSPLFGIVISLMRELVVVVMVVAVMVTPDGGDRLAWLRESSWLLAEVSLELTVMALINLRLKFSSLNEVSSVVDNDDDGEEEELLCIVEDGDDDDVAVLFVVVVVILCCTRGDQVG